MALHLRLPIFFRRTYEPGADLARNFIVKDARGYDGVTETKGCEELDLPRKMARLAQWCDDATFASHHPPASLTELATAVREYQPA